MKLIFIAAGIGLALLSLTAHADKDNPFKPKEKAPQADLRGGEFRNDGRDRGMTPEEVMAIIDQRTALMAETAGRPIPTKKVTNEDVLNSLTFLGEVNHKYIYKDKQQGCYIYEDTVSHEVDGGRCFERAAKRLRDVASGGAEDQQPGGSSPSH